VSVAPAKVVCMRCGHRFVTRVVMPHCICGSINVSYLEIGRPHPARHRPQAQARHRFLYGAMARA
jgi:hypothetical protein